MADTQIDNQATVRMDKMLKIAIEEGLQTTSSIHQ